MGERIQSRFERLLLQEPGAKRVKGGAPKVLVWGLEQPLRPNPHLLRGLGGESEREDVLGRRSLLGQPGDPPRDHTGLAASGPGEHEHGPARVSHRLELRLVQVGEEAGHLHPGMVNSARGATESTLNSMREMRGKAPGEEVPRPDWLGRCRRSTEAIRKMLGFHATTEERAQGTGVGAGGDTALLIDRRAEDAIFAE